MRVSITCRQAAFGGKLQVYHLGSRGIHGQAPTTARKELGKDIFRIANEESFPDKKVFVITNARSKEKDHPNAMFGWMMDDSSGSSRHRMT